MSIVKGKIGNALTSVASDHVVAVTADIYDETKQQYQDTINANVESNFAPAYSSSSTYDIGVYRTHDGILYRSIVQITTAEEWTASHWTQANVAEMTSATKYSFRGNWTTWTDVPTESQYYPADKSGNKTPNEGDYIVVLHADDYGTSQEYKDKWLFSYEGVWTSVGKSGWKPIFNVGTALTDAQKSAINSGITAEKVALINSAIQPETDGSTKSVKKIWVGSKQEYQEIGTIDENTLYYIY